MLDRFASPQALAEAQRSAREKIAQGIKHEPLAANATPEQVAEYRTANGIPDAPTGYDTTLPEGLVIGDADKPIVDGFLAYAHTNNWTPKEVKEGLGWYYQTQQTQMDAQFTRDATGKAEVEKALREEYGTGYKAYVTAADSVFSEGNPELFQGIMQARMPDGTLVGANPDAVRFLINKAVEINPHATITPNLSGSALKTAEEERAALIKESGQGRSSPYWRGQLAAAKQARLLELNTMFEKIGKK